jgi:hypothetical protein
VRVPPLFEGTPRAVPDTWFPLRRCLPSSPREGSSFEVVDLPPEILLLSLACGWPPGANGSLLGVGGASKLSGLKILRVQGKGGQTDHRGGLGRPAWAHLGPVGRPFRSRGSLCIYVLCPLHLHGFDDVILTSQMEVLFA